MCRKRLTLPSWEDKACFDFYVRKERVASVCPGELSEHVWCTEIAWLLWCVGPREARKGSVLHTVSALGAETRPRKWVRRSVKKNSPHSNSLKSVLAPFRKMQWSNEAEQAEEMGWKNGVSLLSVLYKSVTLAWELFVGKAVLGARDYAVCLREQPGQWFTWPAGENMKMCLLFSEPARCCLDPSSCVSGPGELVVTPGILL